MSKKNKKALIIGVNGQDGKILFDLLLKNNYSIIGIDQKSIRTHKSKWNKRVDITKKNEVWNLIKKNNPEEIYYLAAFHFSSQDKRTDFYNDINQSYQINVFSFLNFLEGIRLFSKKTKIFYASSSLIFGDYQTKKQNELTPRNPNSIYGLTKMDGMSLCNLYREKYSIFASVGILYNHESEYRSNNFVSKKIIECALRIKKGSKEKLVIGNLNAVVDWGYAYDYVKAMRMILKHNKPDDFIISTGKSHTVLDFIKITFKYLNLDWKNYIIENKKIIKRNNGVLIGNNRKIKKNIKWSPDISFKKMILTIINNLNKKYE